VFGGEVDTSEKGHEGAGEFENDIVLFDGMGKLVSVLKPPGAPVPRGWGSGCSLGDNSMILFGGLTGSDENPTRLDDVWRLDVTYEEKKPPSSLLRNAVLVAAGAAAVASVAWLMTRKYQK